MCDKCRRVDGAVVWSSNRGVLGSSSLLPSSLASSSRLPTTAVAAGTLDRPVKSAGMKRRLNGKLPLARSSWFCSFVSDCCCCRGSSGFGDGSADESSPPLRRILVRIKDAIFVARELIYIRGNKYMLIPWFLKFFFPRQRPAVTDGQE